MKIKRSLSVLLVLLMSAARCFGQSGARSAIIDDADGILDSVLDNITIMEENYARLLRNNESLELNRKEQQELLEKQQKLLEDIEKSYKGLTENHLKLDGAYTALEKKFKTVRLVLYILPPAALAAGIITGLLIAK